jgi:hypothetical protein
MKDVILDPTGYFATRIQDPAELQQACIDACGFLLGFIFGKDRTVAENMEKNYKFFHDWSQPEGADIVDEKFTYPGDPPLYPFAKIVAEEHPEEIVYIYPHAIVAVVNSGTFVQWTRMD